MSFDFSKFLNEKDSVDDLAGIKAKMDKKDICQDDLEPHIDTENINEVVNQDYDLSNASETAKMTREEKIDYWIEKYRDQPKLVYETSSFDSVFDPGTKLLSLYDKRNDFNYDIGGVNEFEDIVYNSNTRHQKRIKILELLESKHQVKIDSEYNNDMKSTLVVDEVETEEKTNDFEKENLDKFLVELNNNSNGEEQCL